MNRIVINDCSGSVKKKKEPIDFTQDSSTFIGNIDVSGVVDVSYVKVMPRALLVHSAAQVVPASDA